MVLKIAFKTSWFVAVFGLCYGSSILRESLDTRLCRAQFVFKFKVMSTAWNAGCAGSIFRTFLLLNNTYPTRTTTTTAATQTTSTSTTLPSITAKTTSTPAPSTQPTSAPTKQLVANQSEASLPQNGQTGCYQPKHQSIFIRKNNVFRGKDLLKKIKHVKELKTVGIFSSFIRLSLNFEDELSNGDYLFIGRQVGKITNQVFLSNPSTVIPWNTSLEQKINNFDFVKDCTSGSSLHSLP